MPESAPPAPVAAPRTPSRTRVPTSQARRRSGPLGSVLRARSSGSGRRATGAGFAPSADLRAGNDSPVTAADPSASTNNGRGPLPQLRLFSSQCRFGCILSDPLGRLSVTEGVGSRSRPAAAGSDVLPQDGCVDVAPTLLAASGAAFALALLSAVAGFGGGVLLLPVFTGLFGLRVAVPVLTLTQIVSNGSRVWLNRGELDRRVIARFAVGAVPFAVLGALLFVTAPLEPLKRLLGVFLLAVVVWRRLNPHPRSISETAFIGVGAASGLGSALLGSVGPMTAPFFLAAGLTRGAYIGTEAACALLMHLTKTAAYGAGDLLSVRVLLLGLALVPATTAGAWVGKRLVGRISDRVFVNLVEVGLVVAAVLLLSGV